MSASVDNLIVTDLNRGDEFWSFQKDSSRDYVHGLFAYPAMMVPQMQREIISVFKNRLTDKNLTIYDPFMGSGTVLVEGMLQGLNITGIDINPLAFLVSKVKTTIYSIKQLKKRIHILIKNLEHSISEQHETSFHNINKWFKKEIILELDHIKKQIRLEPTKKIRRYFWVAFSETLRMVSNSRSCTYKLHIKNKDNIYAFDKSAIRIFLDVLEKNIISTITFQNRLETLGYLVKTKSRNQLKYTGTINICLGDTIIKTPTLCKKIKPNLIITSPPYGDNHTTVTYGQYSVLALRWIDLADICSKIDPRLVETLSKIDKVSMGGEIKSSFSDDVLNFSPTLRENITTIQNYDCSKIYKVLSFYSDFYSFIEKISIVERDSYVIMTVGNRSVAKKRIEMDCILSEYFEKYSFELIHKFKRNILKKRMPAINHTDKHTGQKTETMTKEHILILKKR